MNLVSLKQASSSYEEFARLLELYPEDAETIELYLLLGSAESTAKIINEGMQNEQ